MSVTRAEEIRAALDTYRRSGERHVDMQRLAIRYGFEGFLRRLAGSSHVEDFVLKGAMSFALYVDDGRSTKDADFQVYGHHDRASLARLFAEICGREMDDGIDFSIAEIVVDVAGEEREYAGFVVHVPARIASLAMRLQFDIGFGEAVEPEWREYPVLLGFSSPKIRAYPPESVIAEKFEAIVRLGMRNSRMKDFYDIAKFSRENRFEGARLARAIEATFKRRETVLPGSAPIALTATFHGEKRKTMAYKAFLRAHGLPKGSSLEEVCRDIEALLMPLCLALKSGSLVSTQWSGGRWMSEDSPSA